MTRDEFRKSLLDKGMFLEDWPEVPESHAHVLDENGVSYGVHRYEMAWSGSNFKLAVSGAVDTAMTAAYEAGSFNGDSMPDGATIYAALHDGSMIEFTMTVDYSPSFSSYAKGGWA